jgi:hypothetical protein
VLDIARVPDRYSTKEFNVLLKNTAIACVLVTAGSTSCLGQGEKQAEPSKRTADARTAIPSVAQRVKQLDKDGDGKLTAKEVSETPFARTFMRWDDNDDGTVTEAEISKYRRSRGIPIEGTAAARSRQQSRDGDVVAKLTIPDVDDLLRVSRGTRPPRQAIRNSAYVIKTKPHAVNGQKYVVLTDHKGQGYLKSLQRLAEHYDGLILRVDDLSVMSRHADDMNRVREQLREANVRYLAIAPRMETYRENTLLGMWELISTIDSDPQLDAFPGVLLASDEEKFAGLIDRSINYTPQSAQDIRPFAISQVPSMRELRSLQKSGILRKLFSEHGVRTPTMGIYSAEAADAPRLPGDQFWSYQAKSRSDYLKHFPDEAAKEFDRASLLVMHGHGIPGMSCGVDTEAISGVLSASVVLCGSCFSASPKTSDFPAMRRAPGGYDVEVRDAFTVRAIDNGACVAFGHMRLSQGFPHLYPVLETWLKGGTVGEAYQELVNGIIEMQETESGGFVVTEPSANGRQPRQNLLLYVVFGDPAVQPFEQMVRSR